MIKKMVKWLFTLVGSLIIFIAVITSTEVGLRALLLVLPGKATAEKVSGSLLSGWEFKNFTYTNTDLKIKADEFNIHWKPKQLLHKTISLTALSLDNATIQLTTESSTSKQKSTEHNGFLLPHIQLPVNIELNEITLNNIHLDINQKSYVINHFELSGSAINNQFKLDHLLLTSPQANIQSQGAADLFDWKEVHLNSKVILQTQNKPITLTANIANNKHDLALTVESKDSNLLKGKITLHHYLSPIDDLKLNALITVNELHYYQMLNIEKLDVNINTGFVSIKPINLLINGKNIDINNKNIRALHAKIQGTIAAQRASLNIKTIKNEQLQFALQGDFDHKKMQWQSIINQFHLKLTDNHAWELAQKTKLSISKNNILLNTLCLTNQAGTLCTKVQKNNHSTNVKLKIKQLDLSILQLWLNSGTKTHGKLNANAEVNFNTNTQQSTATLSASVLNAVVSNKISKETITQKFPSITLNTKLNNQGLKSELNVQLPKMDYLKLQLALPDYNGKGGITKENKIAANLDIHIVDLNLIRAFTDSIDKISGVISSDIKLSGTLNHPNLSGALMLTDGNIKSIPLGIKINPLTISIKPKSNHSLAYEIILAQKNKNSPEKKNKLFITGNTQLSTPDFTTNMSIKSDQFIVSNTGEYQATIASNLALAHNNQATRITGDLSVLNANIAPVDFSSTVTLPSDVVYVNNANDPINPGINNKNIFLDINLILNKINFDYKGLNAAIEGQLDINKTPESELRTLGQVKIINGSYKAYGQNLTLVKDGALNFNGRPSNPQLNLKAYKEVAPASADISLPSYQDKLIVGILITGTAEKPIINFYSDPSGISQQNILSYLVFGFPQNQLSDSQTAAIWQALSMMSPGGGNGGLTKLKENVKENLGLTELGFSNTSVYNSDTQEVESGTSFVVGKRITDNLTLTYDMGVMVPVNVLYLKYKLSQHWSAQTDSSTLGNGADLFYTIQRD